MPVLPLRVNSSGFLGRAEARGAKPESTYSEKQMATYADLESIATDLSTFPDCQFFNVTAIIRPWRLKDVVKALTTTGIRGLTVSDTLGIGFQGGKERYGGAEFGEADLIEKKKVEVIVARDQVDAVTRVIASAAFTGFIGDGKIFIFPAADVIRIRTAETGGTAELMAGGLASKMLAAKQANH